MSLKDGGLGACAGVLTGVIQSYEWGSTQALAAMMGYKPAKEPQAELWFGTHRRGSATLLRPSADGHPSNPQVLDEVISANPLGELGSMVANKFAGELPFLLKVLAVAQPLSLQAHPNRTQAHKGYEAEERHGIPLQAPNRSYVDRNHKPELICALEPFTALCGFRFCAGTAELLSSLGVTELSPVLTILQASNLAEHTRIRQVLQWLWGLDHKTAAKLAKRVTQACSTPGPFAAERRWAVRIAKHHLEDVGVVVALLLNLVTLQPAQALFLEAGNMHCYLEGLAVEVMSNSDNVLRGGLTQKHVNTDALLEVVNCRPSTVLPLTATEPSYTFRPPVAEFCLTRMEVSQRVQCIGQGPEIVLCVSGEVSVAGQQIRSGQAVWVPASCDVFNVDGSGLVFSATVG